MYLSAIERLICRREIGLIGSTSFGFAQNTIHDFQNHSGIVFDKYHENVDHSKLKAFVDDNFNMVGMI